TGRNADQIVQEMAPYNDIGGKKWKARFAVHGVHGGVPFDAVFSNFVKIPNPITVTDNTIWVPEVFVENEDVTKGWSTFADTYVMSNGVPRRLNRYPMELTVI